ncbi:MAG: hypothetical protein JXR96_01435 [Deltaproteobacteria bacterium]|nr:hypothetical protein [Deltaproteobacteria bacterium]
MDEPREDMLVKPRTLSMPAQIGSSLAELIEARVIVQIGEDDDLTAALQREEREHGAEIHVVDRWAKAGQDGSAIVLHEALALNALPRIEGIDLVVMQGDPNWYTTFHVLELLERQSQRAGRHLPCVLVGNVGWPYGRRDGYLDPGVIPDAYRHPYERRGVLPGSSELAEDQGLFADRCHAIYENDLKNGVLTAVEDFLEGRALSWMVLPVPHGMGLIYGEEMLSRFSGLKSWLQDWQVSPRIDRLIQALGEEIAAQEMEVQRLARRDKSLEEERARLGEMTSAGEKEMAWLRAELDREKKKAVELRDELAAARSARDAGGRTLEEMEERLAEQVRQLEDKKMDLARMRLQLEEAEARAACAVEVDGARREEESAVVGRKIEELTRASSSFENKYRTRSQQVSRLVQIADSLVEEIEKHLSSWTWRIGSLGVSMARVGTLRGPVPASKLKVHRIIESYRRFRSDARL